MNRYKSLTRLRIKPVAVLAILVAFVFQLGACPCGCFEHNSWVQLLEFTDHDDSTSNELGHQITDDHHHECSGSHPQYRDTSHQPTNVKQVLLAAAWPGDYDLVSSGSTDIAGQHASRQIIKPTQQGRIALQVFRL